MAQQLYLDINTRPREVLRVMDQVTEEMRRYRTGRRRIWQVVAGLGVAGLIFLLIDVALDYPGGAFAFSGLCLLGTSVIFLVIGFWTVGRARLSRTQWDIARQVLYTLRDDVGRKGRVTGWLDLTGPQQQSKLLRTGRTRSGRVKYYYRDPWFSAKIQLVDGNLLRLTALERIKVKKGYVADRRHQLKVKLVVNSQVYDIAPSQSMPGLVRDDTILQLQLSKPDLITAQEVLSSLKNMYSHLQPHQPAAHANTV